MKIFSIKRMLGLAAIYGAVQYARKNGGAKSAFNGLLDKAKDFASGLKNEVGSVADSSSTSASSPYASSSGIGSRVGSESTSYGGSGSSSDGFGGNGRRGY